MNQNDKDALAAANLIKAYCTSREDCIPWLDDPECPFSNNGECLLINGESPDSWRLKKGGE